nr:uncharacterized protein CTRU02_01519 [Colletotrichum truncatum]KAF6799840.1 hypothetical protein CTRU02_01519 [Colletotrichum truncatum]
MASMTGHKFLRRVEDVKWKGREDGVQYLQDLGGFVPPTADCLTGPLNYLATVDGRILD